jgi:hypothetical protein
LQNLLGLFGCCHWRRFTLPRKNLWLFGMVLALASWITRPPVLAHSVLYPYARPGRNSRSLRVCVC